MLTLIYSVVGKRQQSSKMNSFHFGFVWYIKVDEDIIKPFNLSGISTEYPQESFDRLKELKVDYYQGYLFGKAMDFDELVKNDTYKLAKGSQKHV